MVTLFYILITSIIIHCSSWPEFCRAQSSINTSTSSCGSNGQCGDFGSCNQQESPVCSCLRGFTPQNSQEWDLGKWNSGCARRVALNCSANGTTSDVFLKLQSMKIAGYSTRITGPEAQCEGICLRNCSCVAYAFGPGVGCMFWSVTLMDVQNIPNGLGPVLHIRVSASELDQKDSKKILIVLVVIAVIGFGVICISAYICWIRIAKRIGKVETTKLGSVRASGSTDAPTRDASSRVNLEDIPLFKFEELAHATNNFSEARKLGMGGFGHVYMGVLVSGREIAVKRLSTASGQGIEEFMNEVALISKLQHRNLVRLLGCCTEDREKILVYEYMPNKSLDHHLFNSTQDILDWRKRYNIIEGVCRGLLYLHRDSRLKIIHRDLKPSNILLDNDWQPKISDFGMARIFEAKQDHVSTVRVVGTYGYMAPEYAMEGKFSERSDAFSFGVLMLEIVTGRRNTSFYPKEGYLNLLGYVWTAWNEENVTALIDPRITNSSYKAEVIRCIHIGLLCVQELPKDRPSISAVLSMLSSEKIELPEPKQSAFSMKGSGSLTGTSSSQQSKSSASFNDVTLTMVGGR